MEPDLPLENTPKPFFQPISSFLKRLKKWYLLLIACLIILTAVATVSLLSQSFKKPAPLPSPTPLSTAIPKPSFPPPTAYQKGPFKCPSIPQFCQTGQDVSIRNSYVGFGAKLPANTPIYAAFDGEVTTKQIDLALQPLMKQPTQQVNLLFLTDKVHSLRAVYYFPGKLPGNQLAEKVLAGQAIATASGETMKLYSESSLVFTLTRNDLNMSSTMLGGERVKLSKGDFKQ